MTGNQVTVFTSVLFFALGCLATWLLGRRRSPRTIDYALEIDSEIIPTNIRTAEPELEVSLKGAITLKDPRIAIVRVGNTGLTTITSDDFDKRPVILRVTGSKIIVASTVGIPSGVDVSMKYNAQTVRCEVSMFHPRRSFAIQLILDGPSFNFTVEADFANIKRPPQQLELNYLLAGGRGRGRTKIVLGDLFAFMTLLVLVGFEFAYVGLKPHHHLLANVGVPVALAIFIVLLVVRAIRILGRAK